MTVRITRTNEIKMNEIKVKENEIKRLLQRIRYYLQVRQASISV